MFRWTFFDSFIMAFHLDYKSLYGRSVINDGILLILKNGGVLEVLNNMIFREGNLVEVYGNNKVWLMESAVRYGIYVTFVARFSVIRKD